MNRTSKPIQRYSPINGCDILIGVGARILIKNKYRPIQTLSVTGDVLSYNKETGVFETATVIYIPELLKGEGNV